MALAASKHSLELAHEAVNETGRGVVEDKDTKTTLLLNLFITQLKMTKLLVSFLKTRLLDLLKSQALSVYLLVSFQRLIQHQQQSLNLY